MVDQFIIVKKSDHELYRAINFSPPPPPQSGTSFSTLLWKMLSAWDHYGPPPHHTLPSITPQLRLARGQLSSIGTRQLTGIIIHLPSIDVLLYMMVSIYDEVIER